MAENDDRKKSKKIKKPEKKKQATTHIVDAKEALRNAKTEEYADDTDFYLHRLNRDQRVEYWGHALELNPGKIEKLPDDSFQGWTAIRRRPPADSLTNYPGYLLSLLKIITSPLWDRIYLYFFGLWIILEIVVTDNFIPPSVGIGTGSPVLLLPLVVMLLSQAIPICGTSFFVNYYNDLTRAYARKEFTSWAFCAVLVAQYIEYFFYGGRNNIEAAGTCRIGTRGPASSLTKAYRRMLLLLRIRKDAQVHDANVDGDVEAGNAGLDYNADGKNDFEKKDDDDMSVVSALKDDDDATDMKNSKANNNNSAALGMPRSAEEKVTTMTDRDDGGSVGGTGEDNASHAGSVQSKKSAGGEEEMGFLAKLKLQKELEKAEAKRLWMEQRAMEEITVKDWLTWKCMCCGRPNRRPQKPDVGTDVLMSQKKGEYFTRTYAIIQKQKQVPTCDFCFTYADYRPPVTTAHMFKHYKDATAAFDNFPKKVAVQAAMDSSAYMQYYNRLYSIFFGMRNNPDSVLTVNDWRLPKYLSERFPELPRSAKHPDELFEEGEFVESKLQKADWSRAYIFKAHGSHLYDIRYNTGDEIRFVKEKHLRLPAEKRAYAYRVELAMVGTIGSLPLFLMVAIQIGVPTLALMGILIASAILAVLRTSALIIYSLRFIEAGVIVIFRMYLLYALPLWLLLGASLAPLMGNSWELCAMLLFLAKICSLPILYCMRPIWALFGLVIFVQSSTCFFLLAMYLDGVPLVKYVAVPLAPALTAIATTLYIRSKLALMWDVQYKIRPPQYFDPYNDPSLCESIYEMINEQVENMRG